MNVKSESNDVLGKTKEDNNKILQQNMVDDFQLENQASTSSPDTKKRKLDPVNVSTTVENNSEENITESSVAKHGLAEANSEENINELSVTIPELTESNPEENIPELSVTIPGLLEAALEKRWNECELLLKKNLVLGCPEIKQLQYCKPYDDTIDKAVENGFMDLIKLFIHNGYPCDTLLLYLLKYNREDLIYLVIQKGADVNCKGSEGETPLLLSAEKCSGEVMQLLISKGADINAKNNNNESALHIAARRGNYNVVKLLLDGINDGTGSQKIRYIDLINIHGQSALHLSVDENHYNVAQLLLDRGADVDLKDNDGCTALHICCKHKKDSHFKVFTLLYERHANINERDNVKKTPLMFAAENGNTSIAKCLLNDPYCDVKAESKYERTALDYACNSDIIKLIKTRLCP